MIPVPAVRARSSRNATALTCNAAVTVAAPRRYPGYFLAFEGVDGSGKSTQARLCAEALSGLGHAVVSVREPGGTPLSDAIRSLVLDPSRQVAPISELMLYMAARAQLVAEVIAPALADGKVVVADRFGWSTIAYQGFGRGINRTSIDSLMAIACDGVWPDYVAVLDIAPETRKVRLAQQGRPLDRLERENGAFFQRVRTGFLALAHEHKAQADVYDGLGEMRTLAATILERISPYLPAVGTN